jgi:ABC-type multidrug transport system ATPase subunit
MTEADAKAQAASAEDITAEQARIDAMMLRDVSEYDAIVVNRLMKIYPAAFGQPQKVANRCLSFGVRHGECLGLLGPNGAGKTTCINQLCGFMPPTDGYAVVHGMSILDSMKKIYAIMGVCPQDNHLWDTLTAREHLLFYGRLKNMYGQELDQAIIKALADVQLSSSIDHQAGTFSGGMKRRLSVAISLMGNPLLCYLDEPSTGLDPASRRTLWKCILEAKSQRSMILTTHSMDEAERLCNRLGIFIDGGLHSLAEPKKLTERWGGAYVLTISAPKARAQEITEMVRSIAPTMKCTHSIADTQTFQVLTSEVALSSVFRIMQEKKEALEIRDWGIANSTLEEAFIKIAKGAIGT